MNLKDEHLLQMAVWVALRYVLLFCRFGKQQRCLLDACVGSWVCLRERLEKEHGGPHFLVSCHSVHSVDEAFCRLNLSSGEVVSCSWLSRCLGTTGHWLTSVPTQTGIRQNVNSYSMIVSR